MNNGDDDFTVNPLGGFNHTMIGFDPAIDIVKSMNTSYSKVHIRIRQRTVRKSTTHIENLPSEVNLAEMLKRMKQTFHCNGSVKKTENDNYIELFGDQRIAAKNFLVEVYGMEEENVVIHGY